MSHKLAFVMGGGKFGTNALRYLKGKGYTVVVADLNLDCAAKSEVNFQASDLGVIDSMGKGQTALLVGDAVELLLAFMESRVPDLVVTAIPGNAISQVLREKFSELGYKLKPYSEIIPRVLEDIPQSLISGVNQDSGMVVVSYMPSHMRCRENCMPPKDFCAVTGRPKLVSMDKLLEFSVYNLTDTSKIFRSQQLIGGLGAIDGEELNSSLNRLADTDIPFTLAIGTACDCHGVLNLIQVLQT